MFIEGLHEKEIFMGDFPLRLAVNDASDFDYPLHWHTAIELIYVMENDYRATVNNKEYYMEERDILFIAGGDIHGFNTKSNKGRRVFLQFNISKLEVMDSIRIIKPLLTRTRLISTKECIPMHSELESQILSIINEQTREDLSNTFYFTARIYDILAIFCRIFNDRVNLKNSDINYQKTTGLEKLNIALKYIDDNYQNNITLKEISKAAGFSEYHFSRLFKEILEKNFHSYMSEIRIKKAAKLLMQSDMTITEVAHAVGFNSVVTFNRLFKEIKGCTPTEYRKSY